MIYDCISLLQEKDQDNYYIDSIITIKEFICFCLRFYYATLIKHTCSELLIEH